MASFHGNSCPNCGNAPSEDVELAMYRCNVCEKWACACCVKDRPGNPLGSQGATCPSCEGLSVKLNTLYAD